MIKILFFSSVWIFILLNIYQVTHHILISNEIMGKYPGGFDFKVFISPFLLLCAELFLWFKMFRYFSHPSRIFAGLIGGYVLLMTIFVNLVVSDLYNTEIPKLTLWLYFYVCFGHFVYAFFGKETRA